LKNEQKIEILSVELLDNQRSTINEFKNLSYALGNYPFGWHYLLDLSWIIKQLESNLLYDKLVLDAGAGTGFIQWYLAEKGATVYSVDRFSRAYLPFYFRRRYHVYGLHPEDLLPLRKILSPFDKSVKLKEKLNSVFRSSRGVFCHLPSGYAPGKIVLYNHNLENLVDIPTNSIDFIVSVSALEHNSPKDLMNIIDELMRVLKPGGKLIATLCASKENDWFHEPSKGWCYTDDTLRSLFKLSADTQSNYFEYDKLMNLIINCKELKENLSIKYKLSMNNGLPGGKWDLVYQPVGIVKIKN